MNLPSMLLIIIRQNVLPAGEKEKVQFLAISLDEKWHYFIAQDQPVESILPVRMMARLYLEEEAIIETNESLLDPFGAAFLLEKIGYPNKKKYDEELKKKGTLTGKSPTGPIDPSFYSSRKDF